MTYVVVSVVSSVLFLLAIAMIYAATGTVNMADLALKLGEIDYGTQVVLHLMLLVAFGIKAAVFPLSFWLPDSYPTAPAPVTAVFAGLLTKVGVYAMVRTETLLFPGDRINSLLMVVALTDHAGGNPRRRRAGGHQAYALLHAHQPHRLHGLRARGRATWWGWPRRCTTWCTTSSCRPPCSWSRA